jgi:hypothetical protein
MTADDLEELESAYRATWSLFIAIERGDQETIDAICEEYDDRSLLKGWHVVAARLRLALQQHAVTLGCECGSDEWLEAERLYNVALEDD